MLKPVGGAAIAPAVLQLQQALAVERQLRLSLEKSPPTDVAAARLQEEAALVNVTQTLGALQVP
jgi:hypothetical protein